MGSKLKELKEVDNLLEGANHLLEVSFKALGDERLLLKVFELIERGTRKIMELDGKAKGKLVKEELKSLNELMSLGEIHRKSGFEFPREGKMIILDDERGEFFLDVEKLRKWIIIERKLLSNTKSKIKAPF